MNVAVGSKNSVKVEAVQRVAKKRGIEVLAVSVPSGVSCQPMTDAETKQGAINRARHALEYGLSEIGIGLEAGLMKLEEQWFVCNWGALVDRSGMEIVSGGARFPIPEAMIREVMKGKELGAVVKAHANDKRNAKYEGAIAILTNGFVTRFDLYFELSKLLFGQYFFIKKK